MTKKKGKKLGSQSGFTIVEVLIASTVFVISFTVMVTLLDKTINRFSAKDLTLGTNIANDIMLTSLATCDTTSYEINMNQGSVSYRISKKTVVQNDLALITVEVKRDKSERKIISLYNEMLLTKKQ